MISLFGIVVGSISLGHHLTKENWRWASVMFVLVVANVLIVITQIK